MVTKKNSRGKTKKPPVAFKKGVAIPPATTEKPTMKERDVDILARTIFGEAEGNNKADAIAIAWVVKNRLGKASWPDTVAEVCLQPYQFSCWNAGDPGRERIAKAEGTWFMQCRSIAEAVIEGKLRDETRGSTHYYADYVKLPKWARGHLPVYEVKHRNGYSHWFFNNIDTKPPQNATEALEQVKPLGETTTVKTTRTIAAGAATAGIATVLEQAEPFTGVLGTMVEFAPWLVGIIIIGILIGCGVLYYNRKEERDAGKK